MYIRGLIPRNFAELAEVVPIVSNAQQTNDFTQKTQTMGAMINNKHNSRTSTLGRIAAEGTEGGGGGGGLFFPGQFFTIDSAITFIHILCRSLFLPYFGF